MRAAIKDRAKSPTYGKGDTPMSTTQYVWHNDSVHTRIIDGAPEAQYVRKPDTYGSLVSTEIGGEVYVAHYDCIGSTSELTDSGGNVTDVFAYSAFGDVIFRTGTTNTEYRWVGRSGYMFERDEDVYVRRRFYSSAEARWTSYDPLRFSITGELAIQTRPNAYEYADNRPTMQIDASGLLPSCSSHDHINWGTTHAVCKCCCCVVSSSIARWRRTPSDPIDIPDAQGFGHDFTWQTDVEYIPHRVAGDCTLEWWEWGTGPVAPSLRAIGVVAQKWQNVYALFVAAGTVDSVGGTVGDIRSFHTMDKPCTGLATAHVTDCPSILAGNRALFFALRAKSAPGCPCLEQEIVVYASQILQSGLQKPKHWFFSPDKLEIPSTLTVPGLPPARPVF